MPRKPHYLNGPEIDIILSKALYPHSIGVTVRLMLYCGLRVQESSKITRSDIKRALCTGMFHVRKETAKYGKSRTIPVCPKLADFLEEWLILNNTYNVKKLVLWHCTLRTVQRKLSAYFKKCGIFCTPHDLRHTFASALYNRCRDLSLVQTALGHSNLKTTLIYVHIDGVLQDEINKAYESFVSLPNRRTYNDKIPKKRRT